MDIQLLRTFLEVNRTRHFGQAADSLCVTQAAVSARIKQLESSLDIRLFDRNKRDVRLTPDGHRLKRHAEKILADWRKARQEVTAGGARHQLSISSSPRLWDILLQQWLLKLRSIYPDMAILTHAIGPDSIVRQLNEGLIDLAFLLDPPQMDNLHIQEVAPLDLILVSSKSELNSVHAVEDGFIMMDWGLSHTLELQRAFPDMPVPMTRLSTARLTLEYINTLGGNAYLPMTMVASAIRRKKLFKVADAPVFERHAYAVYPVRSDRISSIVEALAIFKKPKKKHLKMI